MVDVFVSGIDGTPQVDELVVWDSRTWASMQASFVIDSTSVAQNDTLSDFDEWR